MPDPTPHDGFTFHANEAEKSAKESLPTVGDILSSSASALVTRDWLGGVGYVEVGEDAELFVKIREAHGHLSGWKGNAADAFRAHMDRMEFFATQAQHTALLIALQSLGALFSMAYHMRQNYYYMAVAVQAAALHEIDQNNKREEKLHLAIGKGFVQAAFDLPKNLKAAAANFAVETIGALGDYSDGFYEERAPLVIAGQPAVQGTIPGRVPSRSCHLAVGLSDTQSVEAFTIGYPDNACDLTTAVATQIVRNLGGG